MQLDKLAAAVNTTKLVPPGKHVDLLVPRDDICSQVLQNAPQRLLVLTAAAGYGKTSILAQLHKERRRNRQVACWLSLDEEDNDFGRFLNHFIEALRQGGAPTGQATLTLLHAGVSLPSGVLKAALLNELAALSRDCFLFIDDLHLLHQPEVTDLIKAVLLAPLDHLHLVIATRDAHILPLQQLRLRGDLREIGARELRFSEPEIGEFFIRQNGTSPSSDLLTLLLNRTEGWVAGLQFAAIAMRDSPDPGSFLERFSGEHRNVGDFLANEVFSRQTAELQEFLLNTCVLDRFDTALCNAVTLRTDARGFLDQLESANLFVFSLDDNQRWYRYHHLFAEFLQRRLQEHDQQRCRTLHLRAATWLASNGFTVDAIEHTLQAGATASAAHLLDTGSPQLFANGQVATLRAFAARLPAELTARCAQLQLDLAWDHVLSWRFPQARHALELARRVLECPPQPDAEPKDMATILAAEQLHTRLMSKLAHREMMLSTLSDDVLSARQQCESWLGQPQVEDPFMQGSTETALMICRREAYQLEGTSAAAQHTQALYLKGGAVYALAFHNSIVGTALFASGQLIESEAAFQRARECACQLHGEGSALVAMPSMLLAELHYERDQIDVARELLARHFPMSRELGFVDNLIAGFLTHARIAWLDEDPSTSEALLTEGLHLAQRHGFERLKAHVVGERARQLIALGKVREAVTQINDVIPPQAVPALMLSPQSSSVHEALLIAYARVAIADGRAAEVTPLLRSWYSYVRSRSCVRSAVRLGVLLARSERCQGQLPAALNYLGETLALGSVNSFVRTFLDEGESVRDLLERLQHHSPAAQRHSQSLLAQMDASVRNIRVITTHPQASLPEEDSGETLSSREIEILRLAGDCLQNSEIGVSLGLAESTVKWYWQRIYSKMGVHRRSHALLRARSMGLLAQR